MVESSSSRFHHSPKIRSGPSACFPRRLKPRQVKVTGGWSGSKASVLGSFQQARGTRPKTGPSLPGIGRHRLDLLYRAFWHVAFNRRTAIEPLFAYSIG
jgi:hypothetical protein